MTPVWIFTLGKVIFEDAQLEVPYARIAESVFGLIVPLVIGFLIQRYFPRVGRFLVRILKPVSSLLIIFIVVFAIVTNLYLFKLFTWEVRLAINLLQAYINFGFMWHPLHHRFQMFIADSYRWIITAMVGILCCVAFFGAVQAKLRRSFSHFHRSRYPKYRHCHLRITQCTATARGWSNNCGKKNRYFNISIAIWKLSSLVINSTLFLYTLTLDACFRCNIYTISTDSILYLSYVPWMVSFDMSSTISRYECTRNVL